MTMLSSLKALLFSSTAARMLGDGAVAPVPEDAPDFASLLSGAMEATPDAQAAQEAPILPLAEAEEEDTAPGEIASPLPFGLATALNAIQAHHRPSLPLPPGLAKRVEAADPLPSTDGVDEGKPQDEAVEPISEQPLSQAVEPQAVPVAVPNPVPEYITVKHQDKPKTAPVKAEIAKAEPLPDAPASVKQDDAMVAGRPDDKKVEERSDTVPLPQGVPAPVSYPMAAVAVTQPTVATEVSPSPPVTPTISLSPVLTKREVKEASIDAPVVVETSPPETPVAEQPRAAERPISPDKVQATPATIAAPPAAERMVVEARAAVSDDGAATPEPVPVSPSVTDRQPVKSEALALLQLVRDQIAARRSGAPVRVGEQVSAFARTKGERITAPADAMAVNPAQAVPADAAFQPAPSPAVGAAAPAAAITLPTVDLSASLNTQMVDMGVSGQWIDGLARDIAGLSANGAQGRFQIDAHQLGPVQVDIRQGADGAAVSLTVASEAAEMALRQDSDRLRTDAGLSAVRITDVRIERAPHVAEATRAENGGQQSPQQQSSQNSAAWTNNGQNMGQPQGQGRWRPQENNAFAPKNSGDPAVLNHEEARHPANGPVRARYA